MPRPRSCRSRSRCPCSQPQANLPRACADDPVAKRGRRRMKESSAHPEHTAGGPNMAGHLGPAVSRSGFLFQSGAGGLEGRGRPSKGVPREECERVLARVKTRQSQARAGAAPSLRRASWSVIGAVQQEWRRGGISPPPDRLIGGPAAFLGPSFARKRGVEVCGDLRRELRDIHRDSAMPQ